MQYLKETFRYLKGVWWLLAILCLPAAVALGFFVKPIVSLAFLPSYFTQNVQSFADIMRTVVDLDMLLKIWPPILVYVTLCLMFCLTLPLIEKHFRVGTLSMNRPFSLMNHYFLPVLIITLIFAAILVFYFALLISLTALQHYWISGVGFPNAASFAITAVLAVVMFLLLCYFCSPFMFMIPLMQMYGYSFTDAFTSAVSYYGSNKPFKIAFGYASVFLVVAVVSLVLTSLAQYIPIATHVPSFVQVILSVVLHLFLLVYFCAYIMVTTFRVTGMERKDLGYRYHIQ